MKISTAPVAQEPDKHWTSVRYDAFEEGQLSENEYPEPAAIPLPTPFVAAATAEPTKKEEPKEEEHEDLGFLKEVDEWDNM